MTHRLYQCWVEIPDNVSAELRKAVQNMAELLGRRVEGGDVILFEGTERQALAYWKKNHKHLAVELHVGYDLGIRQNENGQWEETTPCPHSPERQYWWTAADGTLCGACCDCGAVLHGGAK